MEPNSFSTILTVGGIGLTVGLLETILNSMDQEKYALMVKIIGIGVFSFFTLNMFDKLLAEMELFLTQWSF